MNVYIGKPVVISDMRGPCDVGFHIPLSNEWEGLKTIMDGLGLTSGTYWRINLHMPFSGFRLYSDANLNNQGNGCYYWSSSPSSYLNYSYSLALNSSNATANWSIDRAFGASIRCFKDSFEAPTSSWTVITGTLGSAGIFRNQTEGLISITSNGTTGYTIQDKNLGATTVYNDGDALSEANCGKFYQWGNNYGFAHSGALTTSSTQVDASNYGPGNYYSSNTFIIGSSDWSSAQNDNLRGGVSQGTGTATVMSELKNAYIGEYVPPYLCFTANTANSTVKLKKSGSPTSVTLETSTDGNTWSTYTFNTDITLTNIGDKVYFRNTSSTDTGFTTGTNDFYYFGMIGSIAASGDVTTLLNKNGTDTLSSYCFGDLFMSCASLTTPPPLPITNLASYCYFEMFALCTGLTALPKLPATTLSNSCYYYMFSGCSNIKISSTQTGEYQTEYRIPTTGTGTAYSNALSYMFYNTGGTYKSNPSVNTTYYTSNTLV